MKALLALLLACVAVAAAADAPLLLRFSDARTGTSLPTGWKPLGVSPPRSSSLVEIEPGGAGTVLHIRTDHAAAAITHALDLPPATAFMWRWKVDHSIAAADLRTKSGDDFAARAYVFFAVPLSDLSFTERIKLRLARLLHGEDLPTTALCYVWDNRSPVGSIASSAYTTRVRLIVLESGDAHAGEWREERRDLAADFRAAFGSPAPRVSGVAVGSDTDNTGSRANAWFGDLEFAPVMLTPGAAP